MNAQKVSFDSQVKMVYPSLTRSEKKICDYIMEHAEDVIQESLSVMGKKIDAGEATILRCIRKLGYENLASFKLALMKDNLMREKEASVSQGGDDQTELLMRLLKDSLQINDKKKYTKAANLLSKARHVVFIGNGTSGYAASAGAYRFFRGGLDCECITDVHYMKMKASLIREDDLVVAVSQSGDNMDIVDAAKMARARKCPVIVLTGRKNSLITKYGSINLIHASSTLNDESYYGGMMGIIVQEFMLEMLFDAYSRLHPEQIEEAQQTTIIATNLHHDSLKTDK